MIRDSTKSIAQDLLAPLQGRDNIAEVHGSGYLAGVGLDGVIIDSGGLSDGSNRRVILEVSQSPVVTPAEWLFDPAAVSGTFALIFGVRWHLVMKIPD